MTKKYHLEPQTGIGLTLNKGQFLKIIDPQGEQVSDLTAFSLADKAEWLSSGRTIDYANKIYLSTGDVLYANDSRPMFTIVADTVRQHDFLLTPCSQEMFELLYKHQCHHPSCFENLATTLAPFGIEPAQISTTFNIFMNVAVGPGGVVTVGVPSSKAGDYIDLRAEMDLLCGLTACSAEGSNNGKFKPIDFQVLDGDASAGAL